MGKRKRRGNNYCLEQTLWFRGAGDNGPLRRPPCTLLVQSSGQTSAPIQSWALGTRRYRHTAAGRVEVRGNLNKWDLTVHVERDWELMNLCKKQAEIQLGQRMRLVCHSHRELKGVCGKAWVSQEWVRHWVSENRDGLLVNAFPTAKHRCCQLKAHCTFLKSAVSVTESLGF